ncbi:cell wall anchor protein [Nocardiopsis protaetiae]|uniref:cell wall anchor protein n=1 Tax=Nocardiopsis protaetiae TaxID=3382270 RepID=UPI00387B8E00
MTSAQLLTLVALGAFHGLHPGMGWMLAVARGLQEGGRAAVLRALPPIAAGHAVSVAAAAVAITVTGSVTASVLFPVVGGGVIVAVGLVMLLWRRHVHRTELRLPPWQLAAWSFVMASAHGAGLMLMPVLAGRTSHDGTGHGGGHTGHGAAPADPGTPAPGVTTGAAETAGAAGTAAGTDTGGATGAAEVAGDGGSTGVTDTGEVAGAPGAPELDGVGETAAGTETGEAAGAAAAPVPGDQVWDLWDATLTGLFAAGVHTAAMLAACTAAALVAHDFLGVHALRWKGVTMDRIWAVTLLVGGLLVLWSVR